MNKTRKPRSDEIDGMNEWDKRGIRLWVKLRAAVLDEAIAAGIAITPQQYQDILVQTSRRGKGTDRTHRITYPNQFANVVAILEVDFRQDLLERQERWEQILAEIRQEKEREKE